MLYRGLPENRGHFGAEKWGQFNAESGGHIERNFQVLVQNKAFLHNLNKNEDPHVFKRLNNVTGNLTYTVLYFP